MNEQRIDQALRHVDLGFRVNPIWGTNEDGTCRCPKGAKCDSKPGKHPVTKNGFKDATDNKDAIRAFMSAPSEPNYGIVWPEGDREVFLWDVDGPEWRDQLLDLIKEHGPLPRTKTTETPSGGRHVFYEWPRMIDRPAGANLFGFVTRWPWKGYVVGPESAVGTKKWESVGTDAIAVLPKAWALAAVAAHGVQKEIERDPHAPVYENFRHNFLRDRARTLRGGGLTGDALFTAVMSLNLERCKPPKSEEEVRRAIGDVETRFKEDPPPISLSLNPTPDGSSLPASRVRVVEPEVYYEPLKLGEFPPEPLAVAFEGIAGQVVTELEAVTNASRAGLLASVLSISGAVLATQAHYHGEQTSSFFCTLVGESGSGRKSTTMEAAWKALTQADAFGPQPDARYKGEGSGEGVIGAVRRRATKAGGFTHGLMMSGEMGGLLTVTKREGSILSMVVRDAFDRTPLSNITKGSDLHVDPTEYQLGALFGITPDELRDSLRDTSALTNGFANRFLWVPVRAREEEVEPRAWSLSSGAAGWLSRAFEKAEKDRWMPGSFSKEAYGLLTDYYDFLKTGKGIIAGLTRRLHVIASRIALCHAALEMEDEVSFEHVERAIALTEYCRRGFGWVFGVITGSRDADMLIRAVAAYNGDGMPLNDVTQKLIRDPMRRQEAIDSSVRAGAVEIEVISKGSTGGRPLTLLRPTPVVLLAGGFVPPARARGDTENESPDKIKGGTSESDESLHVTTTTDLTDTTDIPVDNHEHNPEPMHVTPPAVSGVKCKDYKAHQLSHFFDQKKNEFVCPECLGVTNE